MSDPRTSRKLRVYKLLLKLHGYLGAAFGILIISASLTGIFLNHEDFFLGAGKPQDARSRGNEPMVESNPLLWTSGLPQNAIGVERALSLAEREFGKDIALERIEMKDEGGRLVYKIRTDKRFGEEHEIIIDAFTGEAARREEGAYLLKKVDAPGDGGLAGVDWAKLIEAVHTGEFFGGFWGRLLIDLCAVVIIFLTGSGLYIWWKPRSKSRLRREASEPL